MGNRRWTSWMLLAGLAGVGAWCALTPGRPRVPAAYREVPGARLFYRYDCGKCHSVHQLPDARGTLGVPLDGVAARAGQRVPGLGAREYLRQSLLDPRAHVVEGFLEVMPSYRELMSEEELRELTDWLLTLGGSP